VGETILIAFLLVLLVISFSCDIADHDHSDGRDPDLTHRRVFIMYLAGFSINILTLLGIVLSTGIVVDDAIVVLENIYKKIENGMPPMEAGHRGSREIYFAIISTTITLAAVFLPIIFLHGLTGRLFREFGIVVAGSVLIFGLCFPDSYPHDERRLLHKSTHENRLFEWSEQLFNRMVTGTTAG